MQVTTIKSSHSQALHFAIFKAQLSGPNLPSRGSSHQISLSHLLAVDSAPGSGVGWGGRLFFALQGITNITVLIL